MTIDIRRMGTIAGVGTAALASAMICTASATADPSAPVPPAPAPAPPGEVNTQAAPGPVPHLSSPDNLPPGTSDAPDPDQLSPGAAYARSIWEAIQNHDITWRQGLVLLAQRPMDPNAAPPPGLAAGPQAPGPAGPADAPPAPPAPPPLPWLAPAPTS